MNNTHQLRQLSDSLLEEMRRTFITAHRLLKDASHSGANSSKVTNTMLKLSEYIEQIDGAIKNDTTQA